MGPSIGTKVDDLGRP